MTTEIDMGRVMPIFKGAFNVAIAYVRLDLVTYSNFLWMCVSNEDETIGSVPDLNNTDWVLVGSEIAQYPVFETQAEAIAYSSANPHLIVGWRNP